MENIFTLTNSQPPFAAVETHFDTRNDCMINIHDALTNATKTTTSLIGFEKLAPCFGWLPINVTQATMDKTTQFYHAPASNQLKKHFKPPCHACNVQ